MQSATIPPDLGCPAGQWESSLAASQDALTKLADEALAEHRVGQPSLSTLTNDQRTCDGEHVRATGRIPEQLRRYGA